MTREATGIAFLYGPTAQLHRLIKGFHPNLNWAGAGEMWLDGACLPSFGTQREGRRRGCAASRFTAFLLAQSGHTGCCTPASFDCLQSDVHLKLRLIPNCMLPVMIVQVVQVVHFYFGVFN